MPITIAPPALSLTIDRPAAGATFGVEEPIEVAGSLAWFPAGADRVPRVRVTLNDLQGVRPPITGLAQRTPARPGRFAWAYTTAAPAGPEQGSSLVEAVDNAGQTVTGSAGTPLPIAVRAAEAMLAITQPPKVVAPVPSFEVGRPIVVAGSVTWAPGSPGSIRGVRLRLVRSSDGRVVEERSAQLVAASATSVAWPGVRMLDASAADSFRASEVGGGEHGANSRHDKGVAFAVDRIDGTAVNAAHPGYKQFMQECKDLGATEVLGPGDAGHATHVHAAWPPG